MLALFLAPPLLAGELRNLAFETLPPELRELKNKAQAEALFKKIPDIKKKIEKDIWRANHLGLNYDLNLALKGSSLDWLSLKFPSGGEKDLYNKVNMLLTPAQIKETEKRFLAQSGHRARQFIDIAFDDVIFRFHYETRTLDSLTIKNMGNEFNTMIRGLGSDR